MLRFATSNVIFIGTTTCF